MSTHKDNIDSQEPDDEQKPDTIIKYNKHRNNRIAACIMVKNEELRIEVTLSSLLGFITTIIIYDTGSTDNTVNIITDFCKKHKLSLYLKYGTFIDFSTSRNVMLDFADTVSDIDFLLLLDCNDELQNGSDLIKFCDTASNEEDAFFIKQSWKASIYIHYYNIRLIRTNRMWRYKGVVHEYIQKVDRSKEAMIRIPNVIIFQDRTKDDDKSMHRFAKDKELLLGEYNSPNKTPRTVYYLAQTLECLNEKEEAIKYYTERIYLGDFYEERYQAAYHVGMLHRELNKKFEDYSGYFLSAYEIMERAEPLVRIAEYYKDRARWKQAYLFIDMACNIPLPDCGLFVDVELYNYYRWHLMGIIAYYVNEYNKGKSACEIAISKRDNEIDKSNLNYYLIKLSDNSEAEKIDQL